MSGNLTLNHRKKVVDNRAQDGALVGNHNYNADTTIQYIEISTEKNQRNGIKQNRVFSNGITRSDWIWKIPFLLPSVMGTS